MSYDEDHNNNNNDNDDDDDDVQVYSAGRRALIEERQKREPSRLERYFSQFFSFLYFFVFLSSMSSIHY